LDANSDLLAAKAEYERQQGIRIQVRARMLPQISVIASADERSKSLVDRSPAELAEASRPVSPAPLTPVATAGYDARVQLQQLIFDGLDTWHQTKRYKAMETQARFTMEATAQQTVALTRQSYDAVLWRREALSKQEERVKALQQIVDWTEKKQQVGEVAEYEMYRAQAELKIAEAAQAQARSDVAKAEQYFRRLLMLSDVGPLVLEGNLHPRTISWSIADAISMAHQRRPDLSAAMEAVKAARYGVKAAYGGYLPKVQASVAYQERTSYFDWSRRLDGWTGSVAASWNIFDGLETRGRLRSELATRRTAETRLAELQLQIDSQLRELYAGLELARSAVDAQRVAADLGRRSLGQARRLQELGQASLEQVLQAELTGRQAELGLLEAIYNHNATIAQIEYSVGGGIESADE
jgi:outer membrane protein TolC